MAEIIDVTSTAVQYISKRLAEKPGYIFRLTIKKTGCSGYSYTPEIIEANKPNDTMVDLGSGLTIYVDTAWLHLLQGVKIDYHEEDKMGLKQKRLIFTNPNETGRCGCGESFHVERQD